MKTVISGLLGTALGITITYSTGVASNRTEIVRLATQVENLTSSIQVNMSDRYRGTDAKRDFDVIREKIAEIRKKDLEMEKRFQDHIHRAPNL